MSHDITQCHLTVVPECATATTDAAAKHRPEDQGRIQVPSGHRQRVDDLDTGDRLASVQILALDPRGLHLFGRGHGEGIPKHQLRQLGNIDRLGDGA